MADEERAAKAARAKALLKSHQKKKKVGGVSVPSNLSNLAGSSPQGPPSVASASVLFSPPGSEAPFPDDRSEFGDGLPPQAGLHVPPPPRRTISPAPPPPDAAYTPPPNHYIAPSPKPASVASPPPSKPTPPAVNVAALEAVIQNQQQTISFLVEEKASLTASLEHLEGIEQHSQQSDKLLEEGRTLVEDLTRRVAGLERDYAEASSNVTHLSAQEKDLSARAEIAERDLKLTKQSASDLKAQLAQQRQRVRQLEEQIEGDDRVEQMEKSMKGIQDRAESLEFQLSKSKQAHAKTKSERDAFDQQLKNYASTESEWQEKYDKLTAEHEETKSTLQKLSTARERMLADHSKLQNQHSSAQQSLTTLQQRLSQLTSDHHSSSRQLSSAQSELASSAKRLTQAEETVNGLQKENEELISSLNEMRNKTVELNGDKMELAERIQSLEHGIRTRDDSIAALEASTDQANARLAELEAERSDVERRHQQRLAELQTVTGEHQQGFAAVQAELVESQKVVKDLTADRATFRQKISELQAELDRSRSAQEAAESEKETLRKELNDRARGGDEVSEMLNSTREEIESLRTELTLKEEELVRAKAQLEEAHLRASRLNSPTIATTPNLNEEMMEVARQQHILELSGANSQIRSLETSLFQEQAKTHTLQRRITALEDEVHMAKMQQASMSTPAMTMLSPSRGVSPRPPSALRQPSPVPSERTSGEFVRRPTTLGRLQRPVIDDALSADVRHKRKISLSMLKARIDSEMSLRVPLSVTPNGTTPRMGKLSELEEEPVQVVMSIPTTRPQFGDEEHVFCCSSCSGDLVVL